MSARKGCTNPNCIACNKNIAFKKADEFCSKCGTPLEYVCRKCSTKLDSTSQSLCERHIAERDDRRDKTWDATKKAGATVLAAVPAVLAIGKQAIKYISKK